MTTKQPTARLKKLAAVSMTSGITLGEHLNGKKPEKTKRVTKSTNGVPVIPEPSNVNNIKVIGIGGAGCNALNKMISSKINGLTYLAIHSNPEALNSSLSNDKILITNDADAFGTGGNPEIGKSSILSIEHKIKDKLKDVNMLFITSGLGGGTGSGGAPEIARMAQDLDILTIGIVTKPFSFEGRRRIEKSEVAVRKMEEHCDSVIVISNDQLMSNLGNVPILDSFKESDNILYHSVKTITDLIMTPAIINLDFADVRSVMKNRGAALIGIGRASGPDRAKRAANKAVQSPLLEGRLNGSIKMVVSITGEKSMSIMEASEAVSEIEKVLDVYGLDIIFGINSSDNLEEEFEVTIIATSDEPSVNGRAQNLSLNKNERINLSQSEDDEDSYDVPEFVTPKNGINLRPDNDYLNKDTIEHKKPVDEFKKEDKTEALNLSRVSRNHYSNSLVHVEEEVDDTQNEETALNRIVNKVRNFLFTEEYLD